MCHFLSFRPASCGTKTNSLLRMRLLASTRRWRKCLECSGVIPSLTEICGKVSRGTIWSTSCQNTRPSMTSMSMLLSQRTRISTSSIPLQTSLIWWTSSLM
ncbi:hypothetical protein E2C01_046814 [Portunus trituberculatus]|uniref:Uncharacterized protein n=1 Tax=Portunus trituberculatus TaxID=210409 RepID=A0A5B7G6Q1_PORTR|nr:hypothetical protein [Portunus trituberculatus]